MTNALPAVGVDLADIGGTGFLDCGRPADNGGFAPENLCSCSGILLVKRAGVFYWPLTHITCKPLALKLCNV